MSLSDARRFRPLLDFIAHHEGTANQPGGGYNTSLGYGRFTGGEKNLTAMTLDQINALQQQMLRHPANTFNSSALGRYQIVGRTLRALRGQMGLSGTDKFSPTLQDRLGARLIRGRGRSVTGLRQEWASLQRVSASKILAAYDDDGTVAGIAAHQLAAAGLLEAELPGVDDIAGIGGETLSSVDEQDFAVDEGRDFSEPFESEDAVGAMSAAQPQIHTTAQWGAQPPQQPITVLPRRAKGIVIHHTVHPNTSNTSLSHAFQIAREIQRFHMGPQRNWIDTGQNFTVSRGGHILEGRHRSLEAARGGTRHVQGAHAPNCNSDYVGIENEGTYTASLPTGAQWAALVQLCAWLANQYGMDTANIIGHRQCSSTQCPGDRLFAALPQLRRDVDQAR